MSVESDVEVTAAARLARSRERMSFWLAEDNGSSGTNGRSEGVDHAAHAPVSVGGIVGEVVGEWWAEHPLHTSATLALAASRTAIVPMVKRHPAAVLGSAAAVGAALVWARPWRWLLRPALILGIASQLAARTVTRMASGSKNTRNARGDRNRQASKE